MDILLSNLIESAQWHKKHCNDKDCNISLLLLQQLALKAGYIIPDKYKDIFC